MGAVAGVLAARLEGQTELFFEPCAALLQRGRRKGQVIYNQHMIRIFPA